VQPLPLVQQRHRYYHCFRAGAALLPQAASNMVMRKEYQKAIYNGLLELNNFHHETRPSALRCA